MDVTRLALSRQQLITPHGDLKRSRQAVSRHALGTHYPSWGFETVASPISTKTNCTTHYPSWGFETHHRTTPSWHPSKTHYPSWGFETHPQLHADLEYVGLITPHGDLKPPRPVPSLTSSSLSHYPSWGFETLLAGMDSPSLRHHSLPLMGI